MFALFIVCTSFVFLCQEPPKIHVFNSEVDCNRALLIVAREWRPITGSYTFNCVRVS